MFNTAHSANRGYDLRMPYNVAMGEIQILRVVDPFGNASYQKDTITTALYGSCAGPSKSVLKVRACRRKYNARRCSAENLKPPSASDFQNSASPARSVTTVGNPPKASRPQ